MIDKKYIAIIILIIFFTGLIAIFLNESPTEISNNVTLVVEIGVGFIIAVIIYGISRQNEHDLEKKINRVFDIINENEKVKQERKYSINSRLLNVFENMKYDVSQIMINANEYESLTDPSQKEKNREQIILDSNHIHILAEKTLDDSTIISTDFFDLSTIGTLKTISNVCKNTPSFSMIIKP